jgi:hypothetical protein
MCTCIQEPKGWSASLIRPENVKRRAKIDERPHASGRHCAPAGKYGQGAALRRQDPDRPALPASGRPGPGTLSDARWRERLGRTVGCSKRQFQAWSLDTGE